MSDVAWIGAADLAAGRVPRDGALVLLADLRDPALAAHVALAPTERDRGDARAPLAGRVTFFFARRGVLRALVAARLGVPAQDVVVGHDEGGAPRLLAPARPLFLSVAARGAIAALALADEPIGVDVERPSDPVEGVLHSTERLWLDRDGAAAREAFATLWCAKEAYLKAIGLGLKRAPERLRAVPDGEGRLALHDQDDPRRAARAAATTHEIAGETFVCVCVTLPPPV